MTENKVENFIYVSSREQNNKWNHNSVNKRVVADKSRATAASPFNKLNGWEQCFKKKLHKFPLNLSSLIYFTSI